MFQVSQLQRNRGDIKLEESRPIFLARARSMEHALEQYAGHASSRSSLNNRLPFHLECTNGQWPMIVLC